MNETLFYALENLQFWKGNEISTTTCFKQVYVTKEVENTWIICVIVTQGGSVGKESSFVDHWEHKRTERAIQSWGKCDSSTSGGCVSRLSRANDLILWGQEAVSGVVVGECIYQSLRLITGPNRTSKKGATCKLSTEAWEATKPAILYFQPLEPGRNKFLLCKSSPLWHFVTATLAY